MTFGHAVFKLSAVCLCGVMLSFSAYSQALLPEITVYAKNGKAHITWTSGYTGIKQIGVQWSQDSLYNYSTIGYVSSPNKKVNEYIDRKARAGKSFYRLFILMSNNAYFFSNPATVSLEPATISLAPPAAPQAYQPSIFVYTNPDGNVNISLANAPKKRYDIRFYDADNRFLFSIRDIKKPFLILDKSNFLKSGWYRFELFEDGKEKEKWKFRIGE